MFVHLIIVWSAESNSLLYPTYKVQVWWKSFNELLICADLPADLNLSTTEYRWVRIRNFNHVRHLHRKNQQMATREYESAIHVSRGSSVQDTTKTSCNQFLTFIKSNSRYASYHVELGTAPAGSLRGLSDDFIKEHYETILPEFATSLFCWGWKMWSGWEQQAIILYKSN